MVVVFKFYCTVFSFACKLKQDLSRPIGTKPESKRMQTSYLSYESKRAEKILMFLKKI